MQMRHLRQGILTAVAAAGSHSHAHRRKTVQLSALSSGVRGSLQFASPPADTLRDQEVFVRHMRKNLFAHVTADEAHGGRLSGRIDWCWRNGSWRSNAAATATAGTAAARQRRCVRILRWMERAREREYFSGFANVD